MFTPIVRMIVCPKCGMKVPKLPDGTPCAHTPCIRIIKKGKR